MNRIRIILLAGMAVSSAGCMTIGEHFARHGLERASFEMHCPKEQMKVSGLNAELDRLPGPGNQIGVEGCGKRAVYVLTPAGWLLNSSQ